MPDQYVIAEEQQYVLVNQYVIQNQQQYALIAPICHQVQNYLQYNSTPTIEIPSIARTFNLGPWPKKDTPLRFRTKKGHTAVNVCRAELKMRRISFFGLRPIIIKKNSHGISKNN